jgi:hypothetical protein
MSDVANFAIRFGTFLLFVALVLNASVIARSADRIADLLEARGERDGRCAVESP